jgi:hypothetical protein
MKIRNPELIEEELNLLDEEMSGTPFIFFIPVLRQFWDWINLGTNIRVSDTLEADKKVRMLEEKGYPIGEVIEFVFVKLLEKDIDKPHMREFIEMLTKPVPEI